MSNEAAERLLTLAKAAANDPNVWNTQGYLLTEDVETLLPVALVAERRATVERIRARFHEGWNEVGFVLIPYIDEVLDAELSASPETDSQAAR